MGLSCLQIKKQQLFHFRLDMLYLMFSIFVRSTLILYEQLFEALPFGVELDMQGEDENVPFEVIG